MTNDRRDAITLSGVSKTYGTSVALHPTDLCVAKGEFLTLLGPSGSGKTTLLNLIAGAFEATTGSILLEGREITQLPPRERGIGMVFQNYALMPHMTVFDNVAYPLRVRGMSSDAIQAKVLEALERVGLRGYESRKPRQLSGGQQQRVGIARCIVYSPAVIMMDEPLGALDKNLREQMQIEIRRLHKELGTTFIYVTHDQEEALAMSDRICLIHAGRIAQLGTPEDLYFRPTSRFVAEFIGESNIFSGTTFGERHLALASGQAIFYPGERWKDGSELLLMVRPESMRLADKAQVLLENSNALEGEVLSTSFVGGAVRITVKIGSEHSVTVKLPSSRADQKPCMGDVVRVSWSTSDVVVLHPDRSTPN